MNKVCETKIYFFTLTRKNSVILQYLAKIFEPELCGGITARFRCSHSRTQVIPGLFEIRGWKEEVGRANTAAFWWHAPSLSISLFLSLLRTDGAFAIPSLSPNFHLSVTVLPSDTARRTDERRFRPSFVLPPSKHHRRPPARTQLRVLQQCPHSTVQEGSAIGGPSSSSSSSSRYPPGHRHA